MGRCLGLDCRGGCIGSLDASTGYCRLIAICGLTSFQHLLRNAIDYAKFYSRSHDSVIRVSDEAGNVIETHEQAVERAVGDD
jgi:hypothetical protein